MRFSVWGGGLARLLGRYEVPEDPRNDLESRVECLKRLGW